MKRKIILPMLLSLLPMARALPAADGFAVVVAKSNPATHITRAQLRRMMLGEMKTWPSGEKVTVLFAGAGEVSRVAALKEICGMTEADFGRFTLQASFTGSDAQLPRTFPSTTAVSKIVQYVPGGVGIVARGDVVEGVKLIPVD
jgi:ABC-type phosphate transport system substrate-binding protein